MYWRIRKISPDQVVRQYGVHAICIVSVLMNLGLMTRMSASKALSNAQKTDFDKFARQVTQHLYDANYLTFDDSMNALATELGSAALAKVRADQTVPRDPEEMKAISRQLQESKSVSCVKFDSSELGQTDAKGLLLVNQKVTVVVHDIQGVRPTPLRISYKIGMTLDKNTNENRPIVADLAVNAASQ